MSIQRNIADRLRQSALDYPFQKAVVFPAGKDKQKRYTYSSLTFRQLDQESDRLARGLIQLGVQPGTRMALMVRPGLEFIALTFALFKAGAVIILIDPGMGGKNIIRCLSEVEPEGFVAIPLAQVIRKFKQRTFPKARLNVTVGKPVLTSGIDYDWLRGGDWEPLEMISGPEPILLLSYLPVAVRGLPRVLLTNMECSGHKLIFCAIIIKFNREKSICLAFPCLRCLIRRWVLLRLFPI